jgi:CDP-glucose 4,6-dehydratase
MAKQSGKMENLVSLQGLTPHYKNKKVFLTGHTGFKGSWMMAFLHLLGAKIKGYSLAPEYRYGLFELLEPLGISETVIADIRDKDRLLKELVSFQPDYIFHMAAQPLVRRSYRIPAETFEINVSGTANLLEAISSQEHSSATVVVTTDKVYDNQETNSLYSEEDRLGGHDPYSASKACAELVVSSFRSSFFSPANREGRQKALSSARAGNVIGGGDWGEDRIIPDIVRCLEKGDPAGIRNPSSVRPWQHVIEPLGGYLLLGALARENPFDHSKAYNFGPLPDDHLAVRELAEIAIHSWGSGSWKDISAKGQPHEAGLLQLSVQRAREELRWTPRLRAAQAVDWAIQWYRQAPASQSDYTFRQIKEYLAHDF